MRTEWKFSNVRKFTWLFLFRSGWCIITNDSLGVLTHSWSADTVSIWVYRCAQCATHTHMSFQLVNWCVVLWGPTPMRLNTYKCRMYFWMFLVSPKTAEFCGFAETLTNGWDSRTYTLHHILLAQYGSLMSGTDKPDNLWCPLKQKIIIIYVISIRKHKALSLSMRMIKCSLYITRQRPQTLELVSKCAKNSMPIISHCDSWNRTLPWDYINFPVSGQQRCGWISIWFGTEVASDNNIDYFWEAKITTLSFPARCFIRPIDCRWFRVWEMEFSAAAQCDFNRILVLHDLWR